MPARACVPSSGIAGEALGVDRAAGRAERGGRSSHLCAGVAGPGVVRATERRLRDVDPSSRLVPSSPRKNTPMSSDFAFRQHEEEPQPCAEDGCLRPAYDGSRCKLHADVASYREGRTA